MPRLQLPPNARYTLSSTHLWYCTDDGLYRHGLETNVEEQVCAGKIHGMSTTLTHVWYSIGCTLHRRLLSDPSMEEQVHVFIDTIDKIQTNDTDCIVATGTTNHCLWHGQTRLATLVQKWVVTPTRVVYNRRANLWVWPFQGKPVLSGVGYLMGASDHRILYHGQDRAQYWSSGGSADDVMHLFADDTIIEITEPYRPLKPYWIAHKARRLHGKTRMIARLKWLVSEASAAQLLNHA